MNHVLAAPDTIWLQCNDLQSSTEGLHTALWIIFESTPWNAVRNFNPKILNCKVAREGEREGISMGQNTYQETSSLKIAPLYHKIKKYSSWYKKLCLASL